MYYNNLDKDLDKSNVKFQVKMVWNRNANSITNTLKTEGSNLPWESSG